MSPAQTIPAMALYGERQGLRDVLHCERISDRAGRHEWRIAPHRHPDLHQFFLIRRGAAWVTVDGQGRALALPALLSIPAWVVHGFRFDAGTEGHVLSLPQDALPEIFGEASALAPVLSRWGAVRLADAPLMARLDALFEALIAEQAASDAARAPLMRALAAQIACLAARALSGAAPAPSRYQGHIRAFEALLRENLPRRWLAREYARALSLTPTHLNRITRAQTGLSAARFIEARQMQEARRLLAYTRLSVAEIGYALGFDDPAYFSRVFRRQTGETPTRWRKRMGASDLPAEAEQDAGAPGRNRGQAPP